MDQQLKLDDAEGNCLARDNLMIVFFGKRPFSEMVEGAADCLDSYLEMIPPDALKWSIIGPTSGTHRPLTGKDLTRCRSLLTASTAKQKDIHFRLFGPERFGPDYGLVLNGYRLPAKRGFLDQTNVIEMRFPRECLTRQRADVVATTALKMFDALPCDSGYAAVSLCYGQETRFDKASAFIAPLAFRSHGFDVPNTLPTGAALGQRCRGARWLTMLDAALVDRLGGNASLNSKLLDGVEIVYGAHGLMLRAGKTPEIGDVNRSQTTPLLASVARAIEPVTYFGDNALLPLFDDDPDRRDRWERRFWRDA